jgi:hypothetical protein
MQRMLPLHKYLSFSETGGSMGTAQSIFAAHHRKDWVLAATFLAVRKTDHEIIFMVDNELNMGIFFDQSIQGIEKVLLD